MKLEEKTEKKNMYELKAMKSCSSTPIPYPFTSPSRPGDVLVDFYYLNMKAIDTASHEKIMEIVAAIFCQFNSMMEEIESILLISTAK